jgi:hypothetical protein
MRLALMAAFGGCPSLSFWICLIGPKPMTSLGYFCWAAHFHPLCGAVASP